MARRREPAARPPEWIFEGAKVDYHSLIGGPVTDPGMVVRGEPWQLGQGDWVVRLEGRAGGVAIEALTPAVPLHPRAVLAHEKVCTIARDVGEQADKCERAAVLGDGFDAAYHSQFADHLARIVQLHSAVVRHYAPGSDLAGNATRQAEDATRRALIATCRAKDAELTIAAREAAEAVAAAAGGGAR